MRGMMDFVCFCSFSSFHLQEPVRLQGDLLYILDNFLFDELVLTGVCVNVVGGVLVSIVMFVSPHDKAMLFVYCARAHTHTHACMWECCTGWFYVST